ncbi:type IV pilus modification PilV family protein [Paraglaciecola sp. 2405UD69-4]|uniref:type IV pilus modification PilV family protein n=1 Tax=Paraglaciecola sp. 2405UD69-4 TaxID=3391836 RepID=UPI0039C9DF09
MPVNKVKGFTLIELIIGMIVFAIALVAFTSLIMPQAKRSVDPIFQVRAAELGQSFINEITAKAFDEQSNKVGGQARCNELDETGTFQACTPSEALGPEESNRSSFDDVDDYHGLNVADEAIKNALNEDITLNNKTLYIGYAVTISVVYDDNMNGINDAIETGASYNGNSKLITINIITPNNETIVFSSYRSNF